VAIAAVVVTVGSGAIALQARTPGEIAARSEPPAASTITVPVENRRLARQIVLECTLTSRMRVAVQPITGADGSAAVITALTSANGDLLAEGDTVVELAARPVFMMRGKLPSFRELRPGSEGADVTQLQSALRRLGYFAETPDGEYGPSTSEAVIDFYEQQGYSPTYTSADAATRLRDADRAVADAQAKADRAESASARRSTQRALSEAQLALRDLTATEGAVVPSGELVFVTSTGAQVSSPTLKLGEVLAADQMFLVGGKRVLTCPLMDSTGFETGMKAAVTTPNGNTLRATIAELSAGDTAESTDAGATGQEMSTSVEEPTALLTTKRALKAGQSSDGYTAVVDLERAPSVGPVVPITALWSRPGGMTVIKVLGPQGVDEIEVSTVMEADGMVQIETTGGLLEDGAQVVVSDSSGQGGS